jgi:hypothetical protein
VYLLYYFRPKVTATIPTNPVRNSLPPQVSSIQSLPPAQAAVVTLPTPVEGTGQEAGLFMIITNFSSYAYHHSYDLRYIQ